MIPHSGNETSTDFSQERVTISALMMQSQLVTPEQVRRFELLRLAFFTLKLRKLEQRVEQSGGIMKEQKDQSEYTWRCNLLRHAIFQQIVTLTKLDAREQAMQLIDACRR